MLVKETKHKQQISPSCKGEKGLFGVPEIWSHEHVYDQKTEPLGYKVADSMVAGHRQ